MKTKRNWLLWGLLGVVLLPCVVCGLYPGPYFDLVVKSPTVDDFRFEVRAWNGCNLFGDQVWNIGSVSLWSETEDEYLWCLTFRGPNLTRSLCYGEVPVHAEQFFPVKHGAPRRIKPGERLAVSITYNFDYFLSVCLGDRY